MRSRPQKIVPAVAEALISDPQSSPLARCIPARRPSAPSTEIATSFFHRRRCILGRAIAMVALIASLTEYLKIALDSLRPDGRMLRANGYWQVQMRRRPRPHRIGHCASADQQLRMNSVARARLKHGSRRSCRATDVVSDLSNHGRTIRSAG